MQHYVLPKRHHLLNPGIPLLILINTGCNWIDQVCNKVWLSPVLAPPQRGHSETTNLPMLGSVWELIGMAAPSCSWTSITLELSLRSPIHLQPHHLLHHVHHELPLPQHLLVSPQQLLQDLVLAHLLGLFVISLIVHTTSKMVHLSVSRRVYFPFSTSALASASMSIHCTGKCPYHHLLSSPQLAKNMLWYHCNITNGKLYSDNKNIR